MLLDFKKFNLNKKDKMKKNEEKKK